MNTALTQFAALACLMLTTADAGSAVPMESIAINFTEIEFEYRGAPSGTSPFAIDLVVDSRGQPSLSLRPLRVYDVTLKRGVIASDTQPAFTELTFALNDPLLGESAWGEVDMVVPHGNAPGPRAQALSKFGTGTLVLNATNSYVGDHFELQFRPHAGVTLTGHPAFWFNRPRLGEVLVAKVPVPQPGGSQTTTLQVSAGRQSFTLPVSITRAP